MLAVESKTHAPWYRREWRLWPLGWRALAVAVGLAVVFLAVERGPSPSIAGWVAGDTLEPARTVTSQVEPTVAAMLILWRVVVEPLMPGLLAIALLMLVLCVAIGLMLNYVVLGRTWQR
jgi:hypothetical protein